MGLHRQERLRDGPATRNPKGYQFSVHVSLTLSYVDASECLVCRWRRLSFLPEVRTRPFHLHNRFSYQIACGPSNQHPSPQFPLQERLPFSSCRTFSAVITARNCPGPPFSLFWRGVGLLVLAPLQCLAPLYSAGGMCNAVSKYFRVRSRKLAELLIRQGTTQYPSLAISFHRLQSQLSEN